MASDEKQFRKRTCKKLETNMKILKESEEIASLSILISWFWCNDEVVSIIYISFSDEVSYKLTPVLNSQFARIGHSNCWAHSLHLLVLEMREIEYREKISIITSSGSVGLSTTTGGLGIDCVWLSSKLNAPNIKILVGTLGRLCYLCR